MFHFLVPNWAKTDNLLSVRIAEKSRNKPNLTNEKNLILLHNDEEVEDLNVQQVLQGMYLTISLLTNTDRRGRVGKIDVKTLWDHWSRYSDQ